MAALALMTAACSNDDNDLTPQQPQKVEGITITAQLAPKTNGATTRAVSDGTDRIVAEWAENEHIAILYTKDATQYAADATITAVDGDGAATITFTVEAGTPDNTPCTLVYPYSAAKDDGTGVKDAATLLAAQDGTLSANLDVRVGEGTIQTTTPGLTVTTQPAAQFAIFKFTTKNSGGTATIDVNSLTITIGAQDYVITPTSATSTLYAALPAVAGQTVSFTATGSDSKTYTASKASVTFAKGKYYQSNIKLYPMAANATPGDVGKLICTDGHIHAYGADAACTKARVAMIAYIGDTGHATYTHGLALALTDEDMMEWEAAIDACSAKNMSTPVTNATWLLASKAQWDYMMGDNGAGSSDTLRDGFESVDGSNLESYYYWSSTEDGYYADSAWSYNFDEGSWESDSKDLDDTFVRACLAF